MDELPSAESETLIPCTPLAAGPDRIAAHRDWVRAVAHNLVRDPWRAEDVAQDTLLAALSSPPPDAPDEQRLRAWLGRVAFNLSRLGARQGARRHAREVRVARRESLPSVSDELATKGTVKALTQALAGLAPAYREVVLLRYFDGLSTAEIAAHTRTSELAVRKRLWRARNKLRAALDHDPKSGMLLAALLPTSLRLPRPGPLGTSLAAAAAGLTLCLGTTWWLARPELPLSTGPEVRLASLVPVASGSPRSERSSMPTGTATGSALRGIPGSVTRQPFEPDSEAPPLLPHDGRRMLADRLQGRVLDLDGQPRAGLAIVRGEHPDEVLAISDAFGGFECPTPGEPASRETLSLEARAPGWTTLVPARPDGAEPGAEKELAPLVVARALELAGWVCDESGRPVPGVEFELRCEEYALARLEHPVRLDSATLRRFEADASGTFEAPELARGEGLILGVQATGFLPLDLDTLDLGVAERIVLQALPGPAFLTGTVRYRDGSPARDAVVRLARGHATTDALGRFRLPLRGIRPESSLVADVEDEATDPARIPHFGAAVLAGFSDAVELELGEEHDPVRGHLVGPDPGGWLVAAYAVGGARDAFGNESPSARTHTREDGAFEFMLRRGTYDLYAVAPDQPLVARRLAATTEQRNWDVVLPERRELALARVHLQRADGRALPEAALTLTLRLDGLAPGESHRRLVWKELISDDRGEVIFARDPTLALELAIAHPALQRQGFAVALPPGPFAGVLELQAPRPAFVQVARASPGIQRATLLDATGAVLAAQGPIHASDAFRVHEGWTPVLEVPSSARTLALEGEGLEPVLLPIEPRPGAILRIRP